MSKDDKNKVFQGESSYSLGKNSEGFKPLPEHPSKPEETPEKPLKKGGDNNDGDKNDDDKNDDDKKKWKYSIVEESFMKKKD